MNQLAKKTQDVSRPRTVIGRQKNFLDWFWKLGGDKPMTSEFQDKVDAAVLRVA